MVPAFDPDNSQPNYAVHDDDSIMRDDDEQAPSSSQPARDHDEYETPPDQKIPLQEIEDMMSQYDNVPQDPSLDVDELNRMWNDEMLQPQDEALPSHSVASPDFGADFEDQSHMWDMDAIQLKTKYTSEMDDQEQDTGDVDAAGETDNEEPPAPSQQGGGGARDQPNPADILSHRRTITLTPRATRSTYVSAAQRDASIKIPPIQYEGEDSSPAPSPSLAPARDDSPFPSPSPARGRPLPSLEPLDHGELHYSDGSDGPVISLHIENTAEDEPERDIYKIPIADIREKPGAGLPSIAQYLIHRSEGQNVDPADYGITTPVRGSRSYRTADEIDDDNEAGAQVVDDQYDIHQLSSTPLPGRPLAVALDIVDCGIKLLDSVRRNLAKLAGVSEVFVQARWDKSKGNTGKGAGQGRWRTFLRYYHGRPDAILEQTGVKMSEGEEKWSNAVAARCYEKFKQLFPDTYKEILDNLTGLVELERQGQTVHQRNNEWDKFHSKVLALMDEGHDKGFETHVVACGSNVHQDKGLAFVEESEFADGFPSAKLSMKHSDLMGHFISFVQNNLSNNIIDDSREAGPSRPSKASREAGPSRPSKASREAGPSKPSKSSKSTKADNPPSIISISSELDEVKHDRYHQARHLFSMAGATVGLVLNVNQFPWSTLAATLGAGGFRLINYPIGVSFPGTEKSGKPRGITAVPAVHTDTLIKCLSPSHPQQMKFEIIPEEEKHAKLPVIINAAPQPDSKVVRGSRMLSDGSVDTKGPRRLKHGHSEVTDDFVESVDEDAPSSARTRIKKRKQPIPATDSDSEGHTVKVAPRVLRSKGKTRVTSPTISISDDEGQQHKQMKRGGDNQPAKDTAKNTKRRQVSFQPPEALPPLKKSRCLVEVVIPTPPKAKPTPKKVVVDAASTSPMASTSTIAAPASNLNLPRASSTPKALVKAATSAATVTLKAQVERSAPHPRTSKPATSNADISRVSKVAAPNTDVTGTSQSAAMGKTTADEASKVAPKRPRTSKPATPNTDIAGTSKSAAMVKATTDEASKVASKVATKVSSPATSVKAPKGATKLSSPVAKASVMPAKSKPATRASKAPASRDTADKKLAAVGEASTASVDKDPTTAPAETPKASASNEGSKTAVASAASVHEFEQTTRPVPRRLTPSKSQGGLDTVQPYEGLPRKTSLATEHPTIHQTGGHGREYERAIGYDDTNAEGDNHQAQLPMGERREGPFHRYEQPPHNIPEAPHEAHGALEPLRSPLDPVRPPLPREHSYDGREYLGRLPPPRSTAGSLAGSVGDRQQWEQIPRIPRNYRERDSRRIYEHDHSPHDRNYRERSHDSGRMHDRDNQPHEPRRSYYDHDDHRERRPYHGHRAYSPEYMGGRYEPGYGREREPYMHGSREYMYEHEPYSRHHHLRPPSPYERSRRSHSRNRGRSPYDAPVARSRRSHSRGRGRSPYDAPVASGSRRSSERDSFAPYAARPRTPILATLDVPSLENLENPPSHSQNE